jgi:hypothetical protein
MEKKLLDFGSSIFLTWQFASRQKKISMGYWSNKKEIVSTLEDSKL